MVALALRSLKKQKTSVVDRFFLTLIIPSYFASFVLIFLVAQESLWTAIWLTVAVGDLPALVLTGLAWPLLVTLRKRDR